MNKSAWLELVVPIFANGVLIYLIQSYFSKKNDKQKSRTSQIRVVVREYQVIAERISDILQKFSYDNLGEEQNIILNDLFRVMVMEFHPYFCRHAKVLSHFADLDKAIKDSANNLGDTLKTNEVKEARKHLNELNKLLFELSNECDRYILQL